MSIFVSDNKVYCDSYDCPKSYKLVDDADDIKCKGGKCTKDQCCKKREKSPKYTLGDVGDDTKCHNLSTTEKVLLSILQCLSGMPMNKVQAGYFLAGKLMFSIALSS